MELWIRPMPGRDGCWPAFIWSRTILRRRRASCGGQLDTKPSAEMHFELGLAEGQLGNLAAAAAEFRGRSSSIQGTPRRIRGWE